MAQKQKREKPVTQNWATLPSADNIEPIITPPIQLKLKLHSMMRHCRNSAPPRRWCSRSYEGRPVSEWVSFETNAECREIGLWRVS